MRSLMADGRVMLQSQEKFTIVLKFLTYREVTLNKDAEPSRSEIHERKITLRIQVNGVDLKSIILLIQPSFTPIDHVFRYHEPEHADFAVAIPPFLNLNQPGITIVLSNPDTNYNWVRNSSSLRILGSSDEAMTTKVTTMFLYAD